MKTGRRGRRPLHFLYKILWQFKIIKGSQSLYCTGLGAKPQTEVIGLKTVAVFQTAAGAVAPDFSPFPQGKVTAKTKHRPRKPCGRHFLFGAGSGTWTHTVLLPADFESATSAIPSCRRIFGFPVNWFYFTADFDLIIIAQLIGIVNRFYLLFKIFQYKFIKNSWQFG